VNAQQRQSAELPQFVDDPEAAIPRAKRLIVAVMQARGSPMADFDQPVADVPI
jgi:hypothetical protein